jgi:hypothetical protein
MPRRQVTLREIPWKTSPPTPFHCSFMWNGHEHFFAFTIDPKYGAYAHKVDSVCYAVEAGCSSYIPDPNFNEMKKLALAVMLASDEQRVRWRAEYLAGKQLELPPSPSGKRKKEDERQIRLL